MGAKKPVNYDKVTEALSNYITSVLPAMRRGLWISCSLETGDFAVKLQWNKDCETIILHGTIEPE